LGVDDVFFHFEHFVVAEILVQGDVEILGILFYGVGFEL
jgi:hypothetical protein